MSHRKQRLSALWLFYPTFKPGLGCSSYIVACILETFLWCTYVSILHPGAVLGGNMAGQEDDDAPRQIVVATIGMSIEARGRIHAGIAIPLNTEAIVQTSVSAPMESGPVFRPEYVEALSIVARACEDMVAQGYQYPILVGGGAVEFHVRGPVGSGDFDFVTEEQRVFETALVSHGFRREDRPGWLLAGLYHPEIDLGVQVVSGRLIDGKSDEQRVRLVTIKDGNAVAIPPIEDLIADRLGQYVATTPRAQRSWASRGTVSDCVRFG